MNDPKVDDRSLARPGDDAETKGGPEGNGPDRPELAEDGERSEARGCSNTPQTERFNTCIDYLKFRFEVGYGEKPDFFADLLTTLKVDLEDASEGPGINGYMKKLDLGVGLSLWYGGSITKTSEGRLTTVLEMKGSACRDYEERLFVLDMLGDNTKRKEALREGWIALLNLCLEMRGKCTRIDLPTDDLSGTITAEEIKEKVKKREYTTAMRRKETTDALDVPSAYVPKEGDELTGIATERDSKLSGYTATFGSRDHIQLCIYDKKAEQSLKGNFVSAKSWVRFETRFYHESAEAEIPYLLLALDKGEESEHIASCLAGSIEFKEPNGLDEHHRSEGKTWGKWAEFLKGVERFKPFASEEPVYSIETNARWLNKEAAKAMARVATALGVNVVELFSLIAYEGAKRLTKKDLLMVNQWRRRKGRAPLRSREEVVGLCSDLPGLDGEIPPEVSELLFGRHQEDEK